MSSFTIDVIETPIFRGGLFSSLLALLLIRIADDAARKFESKVTFDRRRRCFVRPTAPRVYVDDRPLLSLGYLGSLRLCNPIFLFGEVLAREPFSVLPVAVGWFSILCFEASWGYWVIACALVWRAIFDWFGALPRSLGDCRFASLLLKLVWVLATGVWLASAVYLLVAALLVLMFAGVLFAAAASRRRR